MLLEDILKIHWDSFRNPSEIIICSYFFDRSDFSNNLLGTSYWTIPETHLGLLWKSFQDSAVKFWNSAVKFWNSAENDLMIAFQCNGIYFKNLGSGILTKFLGISSGNPIEIII